MARQRSRTVATLALDFPRSQTVSRWLFAAVLIIAVWECGAKTWPINSSEGIPIETNVLSQSNWLVGAYAIWLHYSYPLSIDCSPPRACYANSQLIHYHFNCLRGFIYIRERISMDLNGSVVKHEVFDQPTPLSGFDVATLNAGGRLCGPDPDDFPRRGD